MQGIQKRCERGLFRMEGLIWDLENTKGRYIDCHLLSWLNCACVCHIYNCACVRHIYNCACVRHIYNLGHISPLNSSALYLSIAIKVIPYVGIITVLRFWIIHISVPILLTPPSNHATLHHTALPLVKILYSIYILGILAGMWPFLDQPINL